MTKIRDMITEHTKEDGKMQELINFLMSTPYAEYVLAVCLLCRVFVTVAPLSLTTKINNTVMMVISAFALASNKKADNKGNEL